MESIYEAGRDQDARIRHVLAMKHPTGFEIPVVYLYRAIKSLAVEYNYRFEMKIGEDTVFGPVWLDMCRNFCALLDGETGRLDCGTLSHAIQALVSEQGLSLE